MVFSGRSRRACVGSNCSTIDCEAAELIKTYFKFVRSDLEEWFSSANLPAALISFEQIFQHAIRSYCQADRTCYSTGCTSKRFSKLFGRLLAARIMTIKSTA